MPDRAFLRILAQGEREMNDVFGSLAHDIGDIVLRSAGPDGTIPIERLASIQAASRQVVDAAILGPGGRPFDEQNRAQSRYAEVIQRGQERMIDLELGRQAKMLGRLLPGDVRDGLRARWLQDSSH